MTLQELEQHIRHLSVEERLSLLSSITRSLQQDIASKPSLNQQARLDLVNQLRGCLKQPGQPVPTDADIEAIREERLVEKYLR